MRAFYEESLASSDVRPSERVHRLLQQSDVLLADSKLRGIVRYVVRLTVWPASMSKSEVLALEDLGFSNVEIHDIAQIVACFSFMNRIADGTGVTVKPAQSKAAVELLGEDAWARHLLWAEGRD